MLERDDDSKIKSSAPGSASAKMKTSVAAAFCAVLFAIPAFAQAPGEDTSKPIKPGAVRITTKAPEPDKWDGQRSANGMVRVFKCKPLACPDAATVTITFLKSPTRHPDPQALEKFAKVELPKSMRALDAAREILTDGAEKIETISSKTATLKGYPAVVSETKFSKGKTATYLDAAIVFAGPVMIRVFSTSQNRDWAKKSLDQFVEVMNIEEGPALPPGTEATPGAKPPGSKDNSI
jgi:hypothetical protein